MSSSLQIGTRGSVLALAQTDWVLGELRRAAPGQDMGRVIIETEGDRDQTSSLASFGGVGVFVAELQAAILDRRRHLRLVLGNGLLADLGGARRAPRASRVAEGVPRR